MRKKRKNNGAQTDEPKAVPAPAINTPLKGAIASWKQQADEEAKKVKAAKAKAPPKAAAPMTLPPPGPGARIAVTLPPLERPRTKLTTEDMNALERAFAGVQPLTERKRGGPSATVLEARAATKDQDKDARARLDALVGGAARVMVEWQDEYVSGVRDGVAKTALRNLRSERVRPEATLDLHGERASDVPALVSKFVRIQHKKGLRVLLIIVGKGLHSEHGVGVLIDPVVRTLSEGGAAPLVSAFSSAHSQHGGSGALMVELINP